MQIGGEHEDYYDPDFCIYNDVFVREPDGTITIWAYPESVFPPTDFHTATLMGQFIYMIGNLGYRATRRYGQTQVLRLDLRSMQIEPLETSGESPGWIYKHRAVAINSHSIRVSGGKLVVVEHDGRESHEENIGVFVFDVDQRRWRSGA